MPCLYPLSNLKSYLLSLPLILGSFYILCISLLVMFHFTVSFRRLEISSFTPIWEQRFNLSSHMGIYNASVLSLFTNLGHLTTSAHRSAGTALCIIWVTGSPDSYHSEAPHPPLQWSCSSRLSSAFSENHNQRLPFIKTPLGFRGEIHWEAMPESASVRWHRFSRAWLLRPCGLWPTRLLWPWESPGKNWSRLPCPPPGGLLDPGIEPIPLMSPALAGRFFTTRATWETL